VTATPEVLEREIAPALPAKIDGLVDVQISTAKNYPRSITSFIRRAQEMATLTPEITASCIYALPREGRIIEGPSARLAEIVAHAWGNLRIKAGATDQDARYITAVGEAWDLESNVAIGFEVRRRITNRKGDTYNDDMIVVTGNAAASIALRNAVFKCVPTSFWKPIYNQCRKVVAGEAKTFASRRDDMLKAFNVMGVTTDRLCKKLGLNGRDDLTLDHMVTLTGFYNALKDGDTTIEEAFPETAESGVKPAQRKSEHPAGNGGQAAQAAPVATSPAPAEPAPATETPARPPHIGRVLDIDERAKGSLVTLDTMFKCIALTEHLNAVRSLKGQDKVMEFLTRAHSKGPDHPRIITGIEPPPDEDVEV
jgi:hypothetical protein